MWWWESRKSVFVGHSFKDNDAEIVKEFKELFLSLGLIIVSGDTPETVPIKEKVKNRIKNSDLFIGIFTRLDKIEGKEEWTTSDWVKDEKIYAIALKKPAILIIESGVNIGGMESDLEYITFDRNKLDKAFIKIIYAIRSIA